MYKERTKTRPHVHRSTQVLQRLEANTRALENRVDSLTKQMAELTLLIKQSQLEENETRTRPSQSDVPTCSYCKEEEHYATGCPVNADLDTTCSRCGKKGHPELRCWKKTRKPRASGANTDLVNAEEPSNGAKEDEPTVSTALSSDIKSSDNAEVVAVTKRTVDGEPVPKQTRVEGIIPLSSLLNPATGPKGSISKVTSKEKKVKKKKKTKSGNLSVQHHVGVYDVISELAKASSGLTFGQLARGDAEDAKNKLRRILSPGAKGKRSVAAPVNEVSRRLKIIRIAVGGAEADSLFDSGAIPKLVSSRLCRKLSLNVIETDRRITVASGQKSGVTGIVTDVPFDMGNDIVVSMDCLVIDNPPFDVIIGQPALEALQAVIDFGKQEVRLTVGAKSNTLSFDYARVPVPDGDASGTDSEDFTSGSDAVPSDDSDEEADPGEFFVGLVGECEPEPALVMSNSEEEEQEGESLVHEKFSHLPMNKQAIFKDSITSSKTIAWSMKDLRPADVPVRHHFELTDDTSIHHRARRLAPKHNSIVRKEIDDMLEAGIIVPASSAWSFPVVIASKKDGKHRFCVDYRTLNRVMKADRWPLPKIEEIFDDLEGSTVFTTLDLFSGYWQVKMAEASKEKISFVTRYGTYQFEVMPFGLMNAPSTFQRMMDIVLKDLPFARVYIDDVVIFSKSLDEHLIHLKQVMSCIADNGLKIKLSKSFFAQSQIKLLGHVVDSEGIHVDEDKILAIKATPTPTTKTELRSFLGLAGYYRRFIKNFAETSAALHRGTSGVGKLVWTEEMSTAFEILKGKLTAPPVLALPDFDAPFVVETDASSISLGAGLAQKKSDGKIHPVQYASRTMTKTERK